MSSFLDAARAAVANPRTKPKLRAVLDTMLKHAVGHENSLPFTKLAQLVLREHGVPLTKNYFQQVIVAATRECDIFIASTDKPPRPGFFLIKSLSDALTMLSWYQGRNAAQDMRMSTLRGGMMKSGWESNEPLDSTE